MDGSRGNGHIENTRTEVAIRPGAEKWSRVLDLPVLMGTPDIVNEHFPLEEGSVDSVADSNPFVGTWKLISWEIKQPDGTIQNPYGKDLVGYLIYTADGYMSAQIMDPNRQQSDPNFPLEPAAGQTLSEADRARAYSTYLSYCGTYIVKGNTVTHHVKAGLIPTWTGSEQPRQFRFSQGYLIIRVGNHKLIWERAVKHA